MVATLSVYDSFSPRISITVCVCMCVCIEAEKGKNRLCNYTRKFPSSSKTFKSEL